MKPWYTLGILIGISIGALIFAFNSIAFHGVPIQLLEGLHLEGDTIADGTQHPVLMGGDDGTVLRNILVDSEGRVVVLSKPFDAIKEGGSTEMVGKDFAGMTQDELSAAKEISLGGTYSGEVVQACLTQSEEGTGAILSDIALRLFIFDADPSISTADALIATASHLLLLDEVAFANGNFWIDAGAATLCMQMNTLFHAVGSLWFAIATEGATEINSAAEDDEVVDLNFWYRRES